MHFYHLFGTLFILFANLLVAIYVFTNGFLIRRTSLNDTNSNFDLNVKKFDKAVVIFIDALRFDFVFQTEKNPLFGLSTIETLLQSEASNSKLFKFIADPPTTTMQRIKALMSGTLPTFIDAGANFDSFLVEDDNIIKQAHLFNKSTVILGDDTWLSLFDSSIIKRHHTNPSFNIKDLDTNDLSVDENLRNILADKNQSWNILIGHYLGVDHCGHTFGPRSPVIRRKLNELDNTIKFVSESIDEETLLIVMGDHGMTETGDHGGDSQPEVESALFFYSKKPLFHSLKQTQNLKNVKFSEVRQIDLTPTLSLLLGLPIPYSNLGTVILEMFEGHKLDAAMLNFNQLSNFLKKYEEITGESFTISYHADFDTSKKSSDSLFSDFENKETILQLKTYLTEAQNRCREKWSKFDDFNCITGLILIALSILTLLNLFLWLNKKESCLVTFYAYLSKAALITLLIYASVSILSRNLNTFIFLINVSVNLSINFKIKSNFNLNALKSFLTRAENLVYSLIYLIPFSNSFIIQESYALRFLLITLFAIEFYYKTFNNLKMTKLNFVLKLVNFVLIVTLLRVSSVFYVCREEVIALFNCTQTLFATPLSKLSFLDTQLNNVSYSSLFSQSTLFYLGFIMLNFLLVLISFLFVYNSNNLNNRKLKLLYMLEILLLPVYWCAQLMQSLLNTADFKRESLWAKHFSLNVARLFMLLFCLNVTIILKEAFSIKNKNRKVFNDLILNLMICLNLLVGFISGESSLSVWVLILIIELYNKLRSSVVTNAEIKSVDPVLVMTLLQYYFFYATGHESIFTHLKWESGFHGVDGDNNNNLLRLLMGFFIVLNTFSSVFILPLASMKYLSYLDINKYSIEEDLGKNLAASVLKYFLLGLVKVLSTAMSVYVLRRHLMVWKIFAPRFVFEVLSFLVTCVVCLCTTGLFSGSIKPKIKI